MAFLFFLALSNSVLAQDTKVRGVIVDSKTKEPIPFVNVSFINSNVGTITDFDGLFFIETRQATDSIIISYLGYKSIKQKVNLAKYNEFNIKLESDNILLGEVVVKPGENPAHRILDSIYDCKKFNNPEYYNEYEYETYNKLEIDVNNIDDEFKDQKIFNHFQFIFDYIDTSAITGKNFLPLFISESLSNYYFRNKPKSEKEVIKASRFSGIENESISQFTGQMHLKVNIYDNFINAFGKGFVSPIANFGKMYYRYYLVDSNYIDNKWCYQISFKPRRKQEPTFSGDFWVADTSFAIKKVQVQIAKDANINYVKELVVNQEFEQFENKYWMMTKSNIFIDFNLSEKKVGFFGRKTTTFKDFKFDKNVNDTIFKENGNVFVLDNAHEKGEKYWDISRHDTLSSTEKDIYKMITDIKDVPMFKTFVDIVTIFVSGYKETKWFDFGPYYTFYSFNPIEEHRVRIGGRTSKNLSDKFRLDAYVAAGYKDQEAKYKLGYTYMFDVLPRRRAYVFYKHDLEQLGQSANAFVHDNVLASVLRRNPNYMLSMIDQVKTIYEHEWFLGLSNTIDINYRRITPTDSISFGIYNSISDDYRNISNLTSFEVTLNTRFAYQERIVYNKFNRRSLGSKFPIISLDATYGIKGVLGSDYEYSKLKLNVSHKFHLNPFGHTKVNIGLGQFFGTTPYPLLMLHEGNETYAFDKLSYNMMNYYEFVSDKYASLFVEHHFEGFFLNKFPLFRKLKWREIAYMKSLVGSISDENIKIMQFPRTLTGLERGSNGILKPYVEAGVGIENILKIIRIDAIWRLTYLDHSDAPNFGLRASLRLIF